MKLSTCGSCRSKKLMVLISTLIRKKYRVPYRRCFVFVTYICNTLKTLKYKCPIILLQSPINIVFDLQQYEILQLYNSAFLSTKKIILRKIIVIKVSTTIVLMIKLCVRAKLIPSSSLSLLKKNLSKIESRKTGKTVLLQKTVLIAIPNSVEFHNYKSNKLYRKTVILQNVSTSLARFQLRARPKNSPFTIIIESKEQKRIIPPGMHVKLIIFFRCDIFDEPKEALMINVQQGRPVIIQLRGYRDPPILRVFNVPYLRYPREKSRAMAEDTECIMEIPFCQTDSYDEKEGSEKFASTYSDASSTLTKYIPYRRKLNVFDCGECFVGEQVTLSLKIQNIGGEGRFFIMSEIDWCSMHIEDIAEKNMLILPCFAMWPAYFTLKSQEHVYLYIYFFPDTQGMHVETLYAICDNCSVITTEIIGDGITYEQL